MAGGAVSSRTWVSRARALGARARTVRRQQEYRSIHGPTESDLIDLLLDLETLQVIKLGLVALEFCEHLVFARLSYTRLRWRARARALKIARVARSATVGAPFAAVAARRPRAPPHR